MERAEFNRLLQTVQEIEAAVGYQILKHSVRESEGHVEHGYSWNGVTVFREINPMTDHAERTVDMNAYRRIVHSDFTR